MQLLTALFYYGYVGVLILAGGWGVLGARLDHRLLFGLDVSTLEPKAAASLLSQYRFLRAIELGFGLFALLFKREIYTVPLYNHVFLTAMFLGIVARVISLVLDGRPRSAFYFFLGYEGVGIVLIYAYTRGTLQLS